MFAPGGCILINGRWLRYQITRWVSDSDVTQTRMRLGCRVGIGGAAAHLFSPRTMRIRRGSTRKSRSSIIAGSMQEQSCGREELTSPAPLSLVARARQSQAVPATDSDGTQIFDNFDVAFTVARSPTPSPHLCVTANPSLAGESQPSISSRAGARASIEGSGLPCGRETSYSGEQAFYLGDGTGRDGERVAGLEAFLFGARAHARGDVFRPLLGARGAHGRFFRWSLCCSSSPTGSGPSSATGAYVTSRL